ncbi:MAG: hypothetical protein Q4B17_02560 [Lautropia sp.]|nr:hypothetical protein [Lautropia sp.]
MMWEVYASLKGRVEEVADRQGSPFVQLSIPSTSEALLLLCTLWHAPDKGGCLAVIDRAEKYFYLLMVITFLVMTWGWLELLTPDPPEPWTADQIRAEAGRKLPSPHVSNDSRTHRPDIYLPVRAHVGQGSAVFRKSKRLVWGPWQDARDRNTWTEWDAEHVASIRKRLEEDLKRADHVIDSAGYLHEGRKIKRDATALDRMAAEFLTLERQRSKLLCDSIDSRWVSMEAEKDWRSEEADKQTLNDLRELVVECRYWQAEAKREGGWSQGMEAGAGTGSAVVSELAFVPAADGAPVNRPAILSNVQLQSSLTRVQSRRYRLGQWFAENRVAIFRDLNRLLEYEDYATLLKRASYFQQFGDPLIQRLIDFSAEQLEDQQRRERATVLMAQAARLKQEERASESARSVTKSKSEASESRKKVQTDQGKREKAWNKG